MQPKTSPFASQKDSFFLRGWEIEEFNRDFKGIEMYRLAAQEGVSKVEKTRIELLVGGYSIPAIPTQSTENEG